MSEQTNSGGMHSATSSRVLEGGVLPSDLPVGQITDLFGQAVAPASPSVMQESNKATAMSATYGRIGEGSLESAALQKSLESKLRELLPLDGWMMSFLIWKRRRTPALRRYCQLALSKLPTSGTGCGLWLGTPRANETPRSAAFAKGRTPTISEYAAMYPTPRATKTAGYQGEGYSDNLLMRLLPTPSTSDAKGASAKRFKGSPESHGNLREELRSSITDGQYPNPKFVGWMMGYSAEHLNCAPTGTRLSRRSQQSLSKQQCEK